MALKYRFQSTTNSPINIKTAEVLEGDDLGGRAFASFFVPTPGHLDSSCALFFQKNANARGLAGEGEGGMRAAGIDCCISCARTSDL